MKTVIARGAVLGTLAAAGGAGIAHAQYPGRNGQVAWEAYAAHNFAAGSPMYESDAVQTAGATLASCTNANPNATGSADAIGTMTCDFGAPSFSPDGRQVVVSQTAAGGGAGRLMILHADGTDARTLPTSTADEEHPAFLPSGRALVFDGRTGRRALPNLYTVSTSGRGLRQITREGASEPAPCANGTIVYVHRGDLWLLARNRRGTRRLTYRGGMNPSCAPNSRTIVFTRGGAIYTLGTNGRTLRLVKRIWATSPTFSPDGRQIALLTQYHMRGTSADRAVAVEFVNLRGRATAPGRVIGTSSPSSDSGPEYDASGAGVAWQPTRQAYTRITRVPGSPLPTKLTDNDVIQVMFGSGGRTLAAVSPDGVAMFTVRPIRGRAPSVSQAGQVGVVGATAAALSPDGRWLAVAGPGGAISVFPTQPSGSVSPTNVPWPATAGAAVRSLAFNPRGTVLVADTNSDTVVPFTIDDSTGRLMPAAGAPYVAAGVNGGPLAFTSDGSSLAVAGQTPARGGSIRLFGVNGATGALTPGATVATQRLQTSNGPGQSVPDAVQFDPHGSLLAAAVDLGYATNEQIAVSRLDAAAGAMAPVAGSPFLPMLSQRAFLPTGEAISHRGTMLAQPAGDGVALAALPGAAAPTAPGPFFTGSRAAQAGVVAFSPGDALLASGNANGTISVWRVTPAS